MGSRVVVMSGGTPGRLGDTFSSAVHDLGVDLTGQSLKYLEIYASLVRERASRYGLMSQKAVADIDRHFLDAIALCALFPRDKGQKLRAVDVGSGVGIPGVVAAIVCPHVDMTLMDASGRRVQFLEDVAEAIPDLTLEPVKIRAEIAGRGVFREAFDLAISRAVAPMSALAELCLPLVRVGGELLAQKTKRAEGEVEAATYAVTACGGRFLEPAYYRLVGMDFERMVVRVIKREATPSLYPRRDGVPQQRPLTPS
ncbi:MAG: 16S rRNA (guanine(527)-N(7))-methyltransferase RsmG [Chloroflexi bacterium]|nr:16S rRNA (guanine(527)-N(7))-methyltransferase RsmG [Chloroflexota bacterium]HCU73997.1 16S rRNA (guanine(527)-N(7))-methyltransferase RsmG [Chloroflexota bacterium]